MSTLLDPYLVLGLTETAVDDEQVRQAYIQAVRLNPPEQSPEAFARISEAYQQVRTEESRLRHRFCGPYPRTWEQALEMIPNEADTSLPARADWLAESIRVRAAQAAAALRPPDGKEP